MKKADIVGGIIGVLIGLYAIWEGLQMPTDHVMKIGPSFFPIILSAILIAFSSKVISEVSKSLGEDVSRQLVEQLSGLYGDAEGGERTRESSVRMESQREEVIIFK